LEDKGRIKTKLIFCGSTVFHNSCGLDAEVNASRNGPERRSGKRILAGTAFRSEFLVGWCYDADTTMPVPELY